MRNYLEELIGETTLEDDHEFRDDFHGDTVAESQEQFDVIEIAVDQVDEDSTTLESIIGSLRASLENNKGLSRDGFIYASNHIQSLTKRYAIDYSPSVNLESASLSNADLRLTLESAEAASESLWQRFVSFWKQLFRTFISIISSFFISASQFIKREKEIKRRASLIDKNLEVEIEVKGDILAMYSPLIDFRSKSSKLLVTNAKTVYRSTALAMATVEEVEKEVSKYEAKVEGETEEEDNARWLRNHDRAEAGADERSELEEFITMKVRHGSERTKNDFALLPFNNALASEGGKLVVEGNVFRLTTKPHSEEYRISDIFELSDYIGKFVALLERYSNVFKSELKRYDDKLKKADRGVISRTVMKYSFKMRSFGTKRKLTAIIFRTASALASFCESSLTKFESASKA